MTDCGSTCRTLSQRSSCSKKEGIGLIRFNCGIYYSAELGASYMTDRDAYIDALRQIAARAQELEIGLIPCLMWHYAAVPEYFGEPFRSWGRPGSKTAEFLKAYTTDIVTSLREYKSIFAWEFGNEFNLHADLPQYAQRHTQADPPDWRDVFGTEDPDWRIRGNDILYAYRTFTRIVRRLDPDRRMLLSGNAILRETQYNQYTRDRMTIDDTKQYRKISRILNRDRSKPSRSTYTSTAASLPIWARSPSTSRSPSPSKRPDRWARYT